MRKLLIPLLATLLLAGCIHKTTSQVTPWERVTTDNAILAQSIDTLEQGAELAAANGVLPKQTAGQVIGLCGQAATIQLQVNQILASAPNVSAADLTSVQSLIGQVGSSAQTLINSGALGVKNPKSQEAFSLDVQALVTIGNSVVADIQAAEGK